MAQAPANQRELISGRVGPAIIAHGGGNSVDDVRSYVEDGADYLEVDLWLHAGRFEARHERRLRWLPFVYEKWYLRRLPRGRHGLEEVMKESAGRGAGIFLDLKSGGAGSAALLRRILSSTPHPERIVASSQQWLTLRSINELTPEVDAFYSIDVRAKLELFLSVADRDLRPRGVSCRHTLLTERIVRRLHDRGLLVVAWTVDDVDRARELVAWGVDGITTHRVSEMRGEFVA